MLPKELLLMIMDHDLHYISNDSSGTRWLKLHPSLGYDRLVLRMLENHWVHLDLKRGLPCFRLHAVITGNVDVFLRNEPDVWDGMGISNDVPQSTLICHEPGFEYDEDNVSLRNTDSRMAYVKTVLEETQKRGTGNRNIDLVFPRFRRKADADVYLDCLRHLLELGIFTNVSGLTILDILCILCRVDGPFPVRRALDMVTSPAFALIQMLLRQFPNPALYFSPQSLQSRTWRFICGPVALSEHVIQFIWNQAVQTGSAIPTGLSLNARTALVANSVKSLFHTYGPETDATFAPTSRCARIVSCLCTTDLLKGPAMGFIMGRALNENRINLFKYVIDNHPNFMQMDIDLMRNAARCLGEQRIVSYLEEKAPTEATERVVWRCRYWNWTDFQG